MDVMNENQAYVHGYLTRDEFIEAKGRIAGQLMADERASLHQLIADRDRRIEQLEAEQTYFITEMERLVFEAKARKEGIING